MNEIPTPLVLGFVGLVGTIAGALIAAFSKKWRTPADDREDRKVGIEADEKLLQRFEKMLEIRDNEIKSLREDKDNEIKVLRGDLEKVSRRVEEVVGENRALLDWAYIAVRVVRDLGGLPGIAMLAIPPKGLFIADHPSNFQPAGEERQSQ